MDQENPQKYEINVYSGRHFSREDVQLATRNREENCSISLIIGEVKLETQVWMAVSRQKTTGASERRGERSLSTQLAGI